MYHYIVNDSSTKREEFLETFTLGGGGFWVSVEIPSLEF